MEPHFEQQYETNNPFVYPCCNGKTNPMMLQDNSIRLFRSCPTALWHKSDVTHFGFVFHHTPGQSCHYTAVLYSTLSVYGSNGRGFLVLYFIFCLHFVCLQLTANKIATVIQPSPRDIFVLFQNLHFQSLSHCRFVAEIETKWANSL